VSFEVGTTPHGRMRARQVEVIRSRDPATRLPNDHPARWGTTSHLAIPAVLMVFARTALVWRVPVRVRTAHSGHELRRSSARTAAGSGGQADGVVSSSPKSESGVFVVAAERLRPVSWRRGRDSNPR